MTRRTATVYTEALPGTGQSPDAQVVVIEGPDAGRAARIGDDEIVVGSADGCDLVLTDDRVSGRHLAIRADSGRFAVRDLDSKNGTLYEGSLVSDAVFSAGATFKIGRSFVRIQPRARALEVEPSQSRRLGDLVAESLVMREVFAVLELAARSEVTVLLEGETGTGKELAARAVHDLGDRRSKPFVAVDCGALPEGLLESELFGHVRGAFTGAARDRAGAFVRANGGTMFLDELGGVPSSVQARLLRVIEQRRIKPVGSDDERDIDVRIIAASPDDVEAQVAAGQFRADLFYRLSVVRVALPPLRSRREDIEPIVRALMQRRGRDPGDVSGPNLDLLLSHDWPGNVRELRNAIDRAMAMSPDADSFAQLRVSLSPVSSDDSTATIRTDLPFSEAKQLVLDDFERRYLRDLFARCDGNISSAARTAGMDRKHLRGLLRRHGII